MTQINFKNLESKFQTTQANASKSQGSGRKYPYRAVFVRPNNTAKLNVRILYNVKNDAVSFPYTIHELSDGSKVSCGRNNKNNPTCELCDALQSKFNLTKVKAQESAKGRAIMFAQYISSSGYDWTEEFPCPAVGETILVLGPTSLHTSISESLLNVGFENYSKLIADPIGTIVTIARDAQGKQVIVMLDPFNKFNSGYDAPNMELFLASLPSLESVAFFGGITEEDYTKLRNAATQVMNSLRPQPTNISTPTMNQMTNQAQPLGASIVQQAAPQMMAPGVVQAQPAPQQFVQSVAQPAMHIAPIASDPLPVFNPAMQPAVVAAPIPTTNVPMPTTGYPSQVAQPTVAPVTPTFDLGGIKDFINVDCDTHYDPKKKSCDDCLAEKFCPYKVKPSF